MPLSQSQLKDVIGRILDGDNDALGIFREAFAAGEITVRSSASQIMIRVTPPAIRLGLALEQLRVQGGGPSQAELADRLGVSASSVSRLLAGRSASSWPTIHRLVEVLGGHPEDYRELWERTRSRGARAD